MKVILNQAIDNLGSEGEILIVKDGYARNYLIPKGWAKQATKVNIIATKKNIENKQKKDAPFYVDITDNLAIHSYFYIDQCPTCLFLLTLFSRLICFELSLFHSLLIFDSFCCM